jgi:hypothetical protein
VIYSLIRAPHHTSPFLAVDSFLGQWLPGYLLTGGMLAGALVVARMPETLPLKRFALWLALLFGYLMLALLPAYVDRQTGSLGKFYLFRPASLTLLLWLLFAIAALGRLGLRQRPAVTLVALALTAPMLLLNAANRVAGDQASRVAYAAGKQGLADFLARSAAPEAVVLIDPDIEFSFLDFERRTGHPMLISWKFDPTGAPEIREWYRRLEFRKALFAEGCGGKSAYRVDFLLTTPDHAAALHGSCGKAVYGTDGVVLLARAP